MGKGQSLVLFPESEEMEEDEVYEMMEGQYVDTLRSLHYTENQCDDKVLVHESSFPLSYKDPIIWKVKCKIGRERLTVFCLMQKFVALNDLGTKLQILSAFAVDCIKGFVFIEAEKQIDVIETCKRIYNIYVRHIAYVPGTNVTYYLSVQNKCREISEGTWARVKSGKYKGDMPQIVFVNDDRKSTVKLIPRIDLKAMAEDDGRGVFSRSVSDLISQLRTSFRTKEFDEVEEIFVSRELRLKKELENKKKENEFLQGKLELLRNEKASIEARFKEVKDKAEELLNLLDNRRE